MSVVPAYAYVTCKHCWVTNVWFLRRKQKQVLVWVGCTFTLQCCAGLRGAKSELLTLTD
jgi:hypothetical protein